MTSSPPISLLCPTRGRRESALRFAESAARTANGPVEIGFYADHDDEALTWFAESRIHRTVEALCGGFAWLYVGDRVKLSEMWNRLAVFASGEILGHMGDDIAFRTAGWDTLVLAAFERCADRICFVHGNDLIQGPRLGTHGFLHRRWTEAVGYFVPPHFSHDYNDTWLTEVADALGRRVYLADVVTEHLHPDVSKRPYDKAYLEHAKAGKRDDVGQLYRNLLPQRRADIAKLRAAMQS